MHGPSKSHPKYRRHRASGQAIVTLITTLVLTKQKPAKSNTIASFASGWQMVEGYCLGRGNLAFVFGVLQDLLYEERQTHE